MIIFSISTSYLAIYQLAHYYTELKSGETTKLSTFVIVIIFSIIGLLC